MASSAVPKLLLSESGLTRTGGVMTEHVRNWFGDVCLDLDDRNNTVLRGISTVTLEAPRVYVDDLTVRMGRFDRVIALDRLLEPAFTQPIVEVTTNVWRLVGTFVMREGDIPPVATLCDVVMRGIAPQQPVVLRLRITAQGLNIGSWTGTTDSIVPVNIDNAVLAYDREYVTVSVQCKTENGGDGANVRLAGLLRPSA